MVWLVVFGVPIVVMGTHRGRAFETSEAVLFLGQIGNIPAIYFLRIESRPSLGMVQLFDLEVIGNSSNHLPIV